MKKLLCLLLIGFVTVSQGMNPDEATFLPDKDVNDFMEYINGDDEYAVVSEEEGEDMMKKIMENFHGCTIS